MNENTHQAAEGAAPYFLDITGEVCPMTFVRTRLLIEKMPPGAVAEILLVGEEPLQNVPDSLIELGHEIVSLEPDDDPRVDGVHRLVVRKAD